MAVKIARETRKKNVKIKSSNSGKTSKEITWALDRFPADNNRLLDREIEFRTRVDSIRFDLERE